MLAEVLASSLCGSNTNWVFLQSKTTEKVGFVQKTTTGSMSLSHMEHLPARTEATGKEMRMFSFRYGDLTRTFQIILRECFAGISLGRKDS